MTANLHEIWVYLAASPLLHLTLTLIAYQAGSWVYRRGRLNPLLNPVLLAVCLLVAALTLTGTSYQTYFQGAQFVHFLLGPATVALAIPLYRQWERVKRSALAILTSILAGSLTASISAFLLVRLLGGGWQTAVSIAPKSVTAPVAMGISQQLGGLPSLTAVLVILTGILGAMLGPPMLDLLAHSRLERARPGHRHGEPRHRHGPRVTGQRCGRGILRAGDGAERAGDGGAAAAVVAVVLLNGGTVRVILRSFSG